MEIEDRNNLINLYDTYGKLLSKKEEQVMEIYLNQDLGESEIAELSGESRQSVYDALKKAKIKLNQFESKCGFAKKQQEAKRQIDIIKSKANNKEIEIELEKLKTIL